MVPPVPVNFNGKPFRPLNINRAGRQNLNRAQARNKAKPQCRKINREGEPRLLLKEKESKPRLRDCCVGRQHEWPCIIPRIGNDRPCRALLATIDYQANVTRRTTQPDLEAGENEGTLAP